MTTIQSLTEVISEVALNKIPKGTKKPPKGKAPPMQDPVVVHGFGTMERHQAEKHFPGYKYSELKESALTAWQKRMENKAREGGVHVVFKNEGGTHGSTPELTHAHQAEKINGKWTTLPKKLGSFNHASMSEVNEEMVNESIENITMTVPLFIRCLEWAHESCSDDVMLHKFVENITEKGPKALATDDYESFFTGIKAGKD